MEYLRESHLGDLLKVAQAVVKVIKTTGKDPEKSLINIIKGNSSRGNYNRSLTSQASKLVMTFPVLASNTLTPSSASMITKAIERKCVLMIQMLFAADLKVELANSGGIQNVINNYYNGIDFSNITVDDMLDIVQKVSPATYEKYFKETYTAEICAASIKAIMEKCYEDDISDSSLNEYYISENNKVRHDETMVIQEAKKKAPDLFKDSGYGVDAMTRNISDALAGGVGEFSISDLVNMDKNEREKFYKEIELNHREKEFELADKKYRLEYQKWLQSRAKEGREEGRAQRRETRDETIAAAQMKNMETQLRSARNDYFKKQLMDSDVKKANELVPAMLIVNYAVKTDDTKELLQTSAIIGVKTRLVPLDSFEILQKLVTKNKDKSGLLKLIKATTGETKFIKDFVLAIDKAKIDALAKSKKGSVNPIWKVLERRAAVSDLRKALNQKNDASPITLIPTKIPATTVVPAILRAPEFFNKPSRHLSISPFLQAILNLLISL